MRKTPALEAPSLVKAPFQGRMLLACFLFAAALMAVCSKSSFIYPINDWGDANAYVTVARMMMKGKVLYREIFEQKGLYLYLIHIVATLIDYPGFFGVYLMEVLAMTGFLFYAYKAAALYLPTRYILPALPVLGFSVAASLALTHGDSAEELMLPLLAYSMYKMLLWAEDREGLPPVATWLLQGVVTGIIFWTKYTILSFHLGFVLAILLVSMINRDWKGLIKIGLLWLIGLVLGSLPALLYFARTRSFADMAAVYFVSNSLTYAGDALKVVGEQLSDRWGSSLLLYFGRIFLGLLGSPLMTGLAFLGFWYWGFKKRNRHQKLRIAVRCTYASMFLVLFTLPILFNYYFLVLGVLAILGMIPILKLLSGALKDWLTMRRALAATLVILAVLIPRSLASSQNGYLLLYSQKDLPQYQFRDVMRQTPNPTLLTHVNMDHGFSNVAQIVPDIRFFVATNTSNQEREQQWRELIMQGGVDYILSNNQQLETLYPGFPYQLIRTAWHPYEAQVYTYRLYRKIGLLPAEPQTEQPENALPAGGAD